MGQKSIHLFILSFIEHFPTKKMASLIDECARILRCSKEALRDRLFHPLSRTQILTGLQGQIVKTLYRDRLGLFHTFSFDGLTSRGANSTFAYGRLSRTFNSTITQHFYSRHRIRLQYPFLPCAVEIVPNGEDRYYPLELLKLDEPVAPAANYLGNMFKEIGNGSKPINAPCLYCGHDHSQGLDMDPDEDIFEPLSFREPCDACGEYHDDMPIFTRCEQHAFWVVPEDDELTRFPTPPHMEDNAMTGFESEWSD